MTNNSFSTRRYIITGSKRVSNYWWATVITLGGLAFLLTGFAAFLNTSFFRFNQSKSIAFLPQGLIMCFYGSLGLLFGIYLWCTILWGVGSGFNELNKEQGLVRIFRWGLPGKDRRIDLTYKIEQVEGVRVELKEGVNPRRTISLRLKSNLDSKVVADKKKDKKKQKRSTSSSSQSNENISSVSPLNQTALIAPVNNMLDLRKSNKVQSRDIPLTRIGQPIGLEDIENQASELAQFLQVPLDSFYDL